MPRDPTSLPTGEGYTKAAGEKSVMETMVIEAQRQDRVGSKTGSSGVVIIRIGVLPKDGDNGLTNLAETGIELSLEQAREFDEQLRFEIASAMAEKMTREGF